VDRIVMSKSTRRTSVGTADPPKIAASAQTAAAPINAQKPKIQPADRIAANVSSPPCMDALVLLPRAKHTRTTRDDAR
jgi:hypothetical protein